MRTLHTDTRNAVHKDVASKVDTMKTEVLWNNFRLIFLINMKFLIFYILQTIQNNLIFEPNLLMEDKNESINFKLQVLTEYN